MPPKRKPDEEKVLVLHISMDPKLYRQTITWCERNERGFSWTIAKALKDFLEKHKDEKFE